jgi:hypothetical protein
VISPTNVHGFRAAVCDADRCWRSTGLSEAGVIADRGAGWNYFLIEKHYKSKKCVGRTGKRAKMCDAVAVPLQESKQELVFMELKTSGQTAAAKEQLRAGIRAILQYGVPTTVSLSAEIWHTRTPKATVRVARVLNVDGRPVLLRHCRSI